MRTLAFFIAATAFLASPAASFVAQNDMRVEPRGASGFHVAYKGGRAGAPDFWCAAGDYVVRALGQSSATRIYRTTSGPRRAGQGLDFSLSPEGAKRTGLITLFGDRRSVTAAEARSFCNLRRFRSGN